MHNGYGFYIWPCYALLLACIAWQLYNALKKGYVVRQNLLHNTKSGSVSEQQT